MPGIKEETYFMGLFFLQFGEILLTRYTTSVQSTFLHLYLSMIVPLCSMTFTELYAKRDFAITFFSSSYSKTAPSLEKDDTAVLIHQDN